MCEHISVLADEVLRFLEPRPEGLYLDGTLGLGGHSLRLLRATGGRVRVLGLDRDTQILALARQRLEEYGQHFTAFHGCFSDFASALETVGWEKLDGALVDLGVSSLQLDQPDRGFSFLEDGPLDMRMDACGDAPSAADLVNTWSYEDIRKILFQYGEEPLAGRIAKAIVSRREERPFVTTCDLARCVESAYPAKRRALSRHHPATKTFQAVRIAVNNELGELELFLERVVSFLKPDGKIAVISFHSLEDRIVKHFFRAQSAPCVCPRDFPYCQCGRTPCLEVVTRKPVRPTPEEMERNPRSRSAKLRVARRV